MTVHFEAPGLVLHHGDCIEVMRTLPDASVHAVVTDPPYGLEFMGKDWDGADGFRRSLNDADAGRDSVFGRTSKTSPEYNTGRGARVRAERAGEVTERGKGHSTSAGPYLASGVDSIRVAGVPFQEWCQVWASEALRVLKPGGYLLSFGGSRTWHRLAVAIEDAGFELRDSIAWLYGSGFPKSMNVSSAIEKSFEEDPTPWEGWGTALKPAFEPIVVARKPLIGTVAANVLTHGTGALNIDATRTATSDALGGGAVSGAGLATKSDGWNRPWMKDEAAVSAHAERVTANVAKAEDLGRWPTNVILDESQASELDAQTGILTSGANPTRRGSDKFLTAYGEFKGRTDLEPARGADSGGASRFFPTFRYEAKAPQMERPDVDGVMHPTVKPLDLMRWLVRLVTPKDGTILEPFAGSGTTLEAALLEGFNVIGIEKDASYLPLIEQRITKPLQPAMFGDWEATA